MRGSDNRSEAERHWRAADRPTLERAAERLEEYTEEGVEVIRAELRRRGMPDPGPPTVEEQGDRTPTKGMLPLETFEKVLDQLGRDVITTRLYTERAAQTANVSGLDGDLEDTREPAEAWPSVRIESSYAFLLGQTALYSPLILLLINGVGYGDTGEFLSPQENLRMVPFLFVISLGLYFMLGIRRFEFSADCVTITRAWGWRTEVRRSDILRYGRAFSGDGGPLQDLTTRYKTISFDLTLGFTSSKRKRLEELLRPPTAKVSKGWNFWSRIWGDGNGDGSGDSSGLPE
jgi:hypothetical protein